MARSFFAASFAALLLASAPVSAGVDTLPPATNVKADGGDMHYHWVFEDAACVATDELLVATLSAVDEDLVGTELTMASDPDTGRPVFVFTLVSDAHVVIVSREIDQIAGGCVRYIVERGMNT